MAVGPIAGIVPSFLIWTCKKCIRAWNARIASGSDPMNSDLMKTWTLSKHAFFALIITVVIYALFTLFPRILPHPEGFSPWVYLLAFFVTFIAAWKVPGPRRWRYWLIVALCLIVLLDESGYGVEIFGWRPLYIQEYHVYVRDLHGLAAVLGSALGLWLETMHWSAPLFMKLLFFDLALIILSWLLTQSFRWGLSNGAETKWRDRILSASRVASGLAGLIAAGILLGLPGDPKNAFLLGYSVARLGSVAFILLVSFFPFWLHALPKGSERAGDFLSFRWLTRVLGLLVLILLIFETYATFLFLPDQITQVSRLIPIALWVLAEIMIILTAQAVWRGQWRESPSIYWDRFLSYIRNESSFVYVGFAILLIAIAQLIDRGVLPESLWLPTTDRVWGLWTEETFEMTAAFMFLIAAGLFPRGQGKPQRHKEITKKT